MNLKSLLLDELPREVKITPREGQIWVDDYSDLECKVLAVSNNSIGILLDISCYRITGKLGSKKYDELYKDYFLGNFSYKRG